MTVTIREIRFWPRLLAACLMILVPGSALATEIDLAGASSGTLIVAPGASFAQTFAGQTVSGIDIIGSPTGPLALAPAGTINTAWFGHTSLLSQPTNRSVTDNAAPLSILLDSAASSFHWRMGSSVDTSTINADLFAADGSLVNSATISMLNGYSEYSISGLGSFAGITFHHNIDPSGVRFLDMSYSVAPAAALGTAGTPGTGGMLGSGVIVPEPSAAIVFAIGALMIRQPLRRRR